MSDVELKQFIATVEPPFLASTSGGWVASASGGKRAVAP